ncbi:hypothetical protein CRUP_033984 [Coryphaenoides rupestris]|nr:hypothetical protein CRUP_033984 [Coryphaenoides rupestris]
MFVDKENKTNTVVGRGWAGHLDTRTLRHLDPVCSSMAGIRLWFLLSVLYATRSDAWFWTNKDPEPKTTTTERSSVGSGDPKENRKSSHSRGTNSGGLLVEEPSLNQTGGGERTREQGGGLQPPAVVGRGWAGHLDTRTLRHLDPVCSSMAGIRLWFLLSVLYATRSDAWFWTNKDPEPKTTTTERSSVGSGDPKENRKSSHSRGTNSGGLLVEEPSLNQTGGGERTREQGGPNFLPVPSDWPICRHRKYFSLPNYFNHTTAEEVEAFLKQWEWLVRDGCYRNSEWFLCLLATPKHPSDPAGNGNRSTAMLPARRHLPCCSFCHHLRDSCWAKLEGSDFPVDCDSLPTEGGCPPCLSHGGQPPSVGRESQSTGKSLPSSLAQQLSRRWWQKLQQGRWRRAGNHTTCGEGDGGTRGDGAPERKVTAAARQHTQSTPRQRNRTPDSPPPAPEPGVATTAQNSRGQLASRELPLSATPAHHGPPCCAVISKMEQRAWAGRRTMSPGAARCSASYAARGMSQRPSPKLTPSPRDKKGLVFCGGRMHQWAVSRTRDWHQQVHDARGADTHTVRRPQTARGTAEPGVDTHAVMAAGTCRSTCRPQRQLHAMHNLTHDRDATGTHPQREAH